MQQHRAGLWQNHLQLLCIDGRDLHTFVSPQLAQPLHKCCGSGRGDLGFESGAVGWGWVHKRVALKWQLTRSAYRLQEYACVRSDSMGCLDQAAKSLAAVGALYG